MRIFSRRTLRKFLESGHGDAKGSLDAWFKEAKKARWKNPNDVKQQFPTASIIAGNRVVFNIKGNVYRLICAMDYEYGLIFIRFIGTHAEYDKINVEEI